VVVLPLVYSTATIGLYHPHTGAGLTPPWTTEGAGAYRDTPLLVLGGSGSVGQMGLLLFSFIKGAGYSLFHQVIQLAKISGFSPIITTASLKHAEYLRGLGATHVIPRDEPISKQNISAITSAPISIVYDAVGAKEGQQAGYDILAPGGTLVTVLADATEKGTDTQGKKVVTFFGSVWPEPVRPFGRQAYDALLGYLEQGKIKVCPKLRCL
jgi:NADPH:quinone reductase-like Zn-dependent oxidoreductase